MLNTHLRACFTTSQQRFQIINFFAILFFSLLEVHISTCTFTQLRVHYDTMEFGEPRFPSLNQVKLSQNMSLGENTFTQHKLIQVDSLTQALTRNMLIELFSFFLFFSSMLHSVLYIVSFNSICTCTFCSLVVAFFLFTPLLPSLAWCLCSAGTEQSPCAIFD